MPLLAKILLYPIVFLLLVFAAFNLWGALTLGKITPDPNASIDPAANRVVMVFGATGSVGDGLLKAAIEDNNVETIHVVTRSTSPRIEAGVASGRVQKHIHADFENYDSLRPVLRTVNTVLWALGTSSLQVDEDTYTWIHVNFPIAFVTTWLEERTAGPMSFHNVTGMGTDPEGDQRWARDKGGTELQVATMGEGTGLRGFGYHSAFVRPTSEQSNVLIYALELLLKPGKLVIRGKSLGQAMLEISARTEELPNGTIIDNADSIAYAKAYQQRLQ